MPDIAVITVSVDNYCGRGALYAERLHRAIERNFRIPHTLYSITDEPAPRAIPLKPDPELRGWWQKLMLFRPGLVEERRIVFFDLDTLILGDVSEIADYVGDFATLRDFWRPEGLGPAVMLFRNGYGHALWEEFAAAGKPMHSGNGDQTWIENRAKPHILQDIFPRTFVSYKEHCLGRAMPPPGAKVICFHGRPRIHEVEGWPREVWEGR